MFTPDESLRRALESRQYGRPLALGASIRDGMADWDFIALPDFMAAKTNIMRHGKGRKAGGTAMSLSELPWTLAAWAWRQIGFGAGEGEDKMPSGQHPLVVLVNVEAAAQAFAERIQVTDAEGSPYVSRVQRTFSRTMFSKRFEDLLGSQPRERLSAADMDVLLKYLSREKGELVYDGRAVRIKAPGESDLRAISEEDASIASTRELLEYLEHQTEMLSKRVDELSAKAKEAVAKKNRVAALAALRSKKLAETSLETRLATRSRLEEVVDKIEQAADQVALVKVMESSADVLKSLNEQVGGVERVEDIVERLREQVGQADEVQSILAEPGVIGGNVVDETEIDDELEAMEKEETYKREEAEKKAREEKEQKQAEETRKRLDGMEQLRPLPDRMKPSESAEISKIERSEDQKESIAETTAGVRKLSLEEQPQVAN
jgi:charged multivesicular body protein 7